MVEMSPEESLHEALREPSSDPPRKRDLVLVPVSEAQATSDIDRLMKKEQLVEARKKAAEKRVLKEKERLEDRNAAISESSARAHKDFAESRAAYAATAKAEREIQELQKRQALLKLRPGFLQSGEDRALRAEIRGAEAARHESKARAKRELAEARAARSVELANRASAAKIREEAKQARRLASQEKLRLRQLKIETREKQREVKVRKHQRRAPSKPARRRKRRADRDFSFSGFFEGSGRERRKSR
jgi:hypothetical protein